MSLEESVQSNTAAIGELTEAILALIEQQRTSVVMTVDMDEPKPVAVEKPKPAKKKAEPKPEPTPEPEVIEEEAVVEEADEALTIDAVRAKLMPVVQDEKFGPQVISDALKGFTAATLSDLDVCDYQKLLNVVAEATGLEL